MTKLTVRPIVGVRCIGAAAMAASALLAFPAFGYSATTVGSDLSGDPVDNGCTTVTPCTFVSSQAGAPLPQASPIDGVIVRWRVKAGASQNGDVALRVVNVDSAFNATAHGTSETRVTVAGTNEFPTRMPIASGQAIGLDNATAGLYFAVGSGVNNHAWRPQLVDNDPTPQAFDHPGTDVLLLNADVELDADHDGYGDETQDACPSNPSVHAACPATATPTDTTKPILGSLGMSVTVFRAAKSGPSASAKKKPVGTKVRFNLSEPGTVKFTVERKTRGRKVSKKCVAQTKANRKKRACVRWVRVKGSFTRAGKAGKNSFKFRGRIGGKRLKPGTYRLDGQATDAAKNKSALKRKSFKIVR